MRGGAGSGWGGMERGVGDRKGEAIEDEEEEEEEEEEKEEEKSGAGRGVSKSGESGVGRV